MFFVKIKPKEEILKTISSYRKLLYIICSGCSEVNFSLKEAIKFFENNRNIYNIEMKILDYICNQSYVNNYKDKLKSKIEDSQAIITFSCGIGTATLSSALNQKIVLTISNTFYLSGYKGYNVPYEGKFECVLCGSCHLNFTAGICPVSNCPKSLLNGPCGGAKNGKCEVSKTKDCVWEKIFFRLKKTNKLKTFINGKILIHNHKTLL